MDSGLIQQVHQLQVNFFKLELNSILNSPSFPDTISSQDMDAPIPECLNDYETPVANFSAIGVGAYESFTDCACLLILVNIIACFIFAQCLSILSKFYSRPNEKKTPNPKGKPHGSICMIFTPFECNKILEATQIMKPLTDKPIYQSPIPEAIQAEFKSEDLNVPKLPSESDNDPTEDSE